MPEGLAVMLQTVGSGISLAATGVEMKASVAAGDDALIVRELLRRGDEDLYAVLVERHKLRVIQVAAAVLGPGHEADAEDVAQEAFLRAFRKLASFRGECSFGTWIIRMARNLAIDRSRRADHRHPHLQDEYLRDRHSPAAGGNPEAEAMACERRQILFDTLDRLSQPQRMVVYLFYWTGCPVAEIAQLLELNQETVKSHLHRSRRRLAETLDERQIHG